MDYGKEERALSWHTLISSSKLDLSRLMTQETLNSFPSLMLSVQKVHVSPIYRKIYLDIWHKK